MYFPYDKPDGNGNIYTKDAVSNALLKDMNLMPIIVQGDNDLDKFPIGFITSHQCEVEDEPENSRFRFTLEGYIPHAGTAEGAELEDGFITSFDIHSVGISLK